MKPLYLLVASVLPFTALAAPGVILDYRKQSCRLGTKESSPSKKSYQKARVDDWFGLWLNSHWKKKKSKKSEKGLVATFGKWALGDDGFTCKDNGNDDNCDIDVCNEILNSKHPHDARNAYYVLRSIQNLHSYFKGQNEAFQTGAISAAFAKDAWAGLFYDGDDPKEGQIVKDILDIVSTVFGVAGAAAALGAEAIAVSSNIVSALVGGSTTSAYQAVSSGNEEFQVASSIGQLLGDLTLQWSNSRVKGNNELMQGMKFGDMYLDDWIKGGLWVDYPGVPKDEVASNTYAMLKAVAINQIWRMQRVYIIGGGKCGDNQGLGEGTGGTDNGAYAWCDKSSNQAWYLYYWQKGDHGLPTDKGWTARPWGADRLGTDAFSDIKAQQVIKSSLKSYRAAKFDYTADRLQERSAHAFAKGQRPFKDGAEMEGLFTIPVCDISKSVNKSFDLKKYVLQPYKYTNRSVWCAPICEADLDTSVKFMEAIGMADTDDAIHGCPGAKGTPKSYWQNKGGFK
ncbi:hypothetical protein AJ79_07927 [Helicocarpus griseus UAMH5409]|uniref:Uncharacterized protein n=1 Tax=Helicocarpus griseus UAMH5409 TaxID=1447875 RepID=A0A2B7WX52_9EURO|nr:hypothetical protein AJ79_07927 [Helicocarpus griseus UAMH5409]